MINIKGTLLFLLPSAFMLLLVACGGPAALSVDIEATPQKTGTENQDVIFWNAAKSNAPKCTADFEFSHAFADPKEVREIYFGGERHIAPHEHMVYWATHEIGTPSELNNPDAPATLKTETAAANPPHATQVSEKMDIITTANG